MPSYRNEQTTKAVVLSYLAQTYENLEIRIFDNGAPENAYALRDFVVKLNDPRVCFHANIRQISATYNYGRIFAELDSNALALILSSDMGLAPNAVEVMVNSLEKSGSSAVYPGYRYYDVSNIDPDIELDFDTWPYRNEFHGNTISKKKASKEIFLEFFDEANLIGEFSGFSAFGAMFDPNFLRNFPTEWSGFAGHGIEQFVSMNLLLRMESVFLNSENLIFNVYGRPRIGGTQRLDSDIYRIDCILAAQKVIEDNVMLLESKGLDVDRLRILQIKKAKYFLDKYSGFERYASMVIRQNEYFLNL